MNPEIKKAWVEALRSGRYKQARGKLKSRNGAMCCLGVLADLQGKEWVWQSNEGAYLDFDLTYFPELKRAKVSRSAAKLLAEMNDGYGVTQRRSFTEIADYIEANL